MNREAVTPQKTPWVALWRAETLKLLSRSSSQIVLLICALLGLSGPVALGLVSRSGAIVMGAPVEAVLDLSASMASQWSLEVRNFFTFRVLLIMLGALVFAGEYQRRTLREELLRPVSRTQVLLAKWAALVNFVLLSTAVTWLVSAAAGLLLFPNAGMWGPPTLAYLATPLTDAGYAALILCVSILSRSVAGTIAGVFLVMVFNAVLSFVLLLLQGAAARANESLLLSLVEGLQPWLPSSAYGVWATFIRGDLDVRSFIALGLYTVLFLVIADQVFRRVDVP